MTNSADPDQKLTEANKAYRSAGQGLTDSNTLSSLHRRIGVTEILLALCKQPPLSLSLSLSTHSVLHILHICWKDHIFV